MWPPRGGPRGPRPTTGSAAGAEPGSPAHRSPGVRTPWSGPPDGRGDSDAPLLLSVRSGARFSMPAEHRLPRRALLHHRFWCPWCTMFAFQPWHSAIEFRRLPGARGRADGPGRGSSGPTAGTFGTSGNRVVRRRVVEGAAPIPRGFAPCTWSGPGTVAGVGEPVSDRLMCSSG
ncbi:oleate hydratase [Streptomyces sp. NPDC005476]|uniref:oleate hydratase n=1 Tax=Streptomyces sp. NPDC005476 TaxID=3156882 RepID=UPI003454495C